MPIYIHIAFWAAFLLLGNVTGSHKRDGQILGVLAGVLGFAVVMIIYVCMMINW